MEAETVLSSRERTFTSYLGCFWLNVQVLYVYVKVTCKNHIHMCPNERLSQLLQRSKGQKISLCQTQKITDNSRKKKKRKSFEI